MVDDNGAVTLAGVERTVTATTLMADYAECAVTVGWLRGGRRTDKSEVSIGRRTTQLVATALPPGVDKSKSRGLPGWLLVPVNENGLVTARRKGNRFVITAPPLEDEQQSGFLHGSR